MSAELDGAAVNARYVEAVAFPNSKEDALAKAILLIIQHLEKYQ